MSDARITKERALQALDNLDDCARMDCGVDAVGPRSTLAVYINQAEEIIAAAQRQAREEPVALLRALVAALDGAFISSWQTTAAWQQELDAAREWLTAQDRQTPTGGA